MDDTRHSGFTLIELLVVVAIVALLAGVAVPATGRYIDNARLRAAAEALLQELRQARNHALNFKQPVHFSFAGASAQNWCYGWSTGGACDCQRPGNCANSQTGHQSRQRFATEFPSVALQTRASAARRTLAFTAVRATASADSIRLSNPAGVVKVVVSPLGRIRLCALTGSLYPPC